MLGGAYDFPEQSFNMVGGDKKTVTGMGGQGSQANVGASPVNPPANRATELKQKQAKLDKFKADVKSKNGFLSLKHGSKIVVEPKKVNDQNFDSNLNTELTNLKTELETNGFDLIVSNGEVVIEDLRIQGTPSSSVSSKMYDFLPEGGVEEGYVNHIPNDTDIGSLAAASLVANTQLLRPLAAPFMFMGEGQAKQTGGAIVISNAPNVKTYCSGTNFLVQEIDRLLSTMAGKGLKLSDGSNEKINGLKNKLENTEKELCAIHDLLDSIDAGAQSNADGTYKNPELDPNASYPDLMKKKANFEAQAKKVQSVLFSSIMTLSQVINQQVGEVFDEKARAGVFGPQAKNAASSAAASEEKDDRIVLN